MFCSNCGKELPENSKFCGGCGQRVEVKSEEIPVQNPVVQEVPVQEPAPVEEVPVQPAAPVVPEAAPAAPKAAPKAPAVAPKAQAPKKRGKLLIAAVAAVVVIAIVVGLVASIGGGAPARYVYITDDGELMYVQDLKKPEAIEISDEVQGYLLATVTDDGKYLYYVEMDEDEDSGTLYRVALAKAAKAVEPEKISSNVTGFRVLENGNAYYYKEGSSNTQIWLYDGNDTTKLVSNYYGIYGTDEDQKYLYYYEYDDEWRRTTYRVSLSADAEDERLIKNADYVYSAYDAVHFVYGVEEETDEGYRERLYVETLDGDKEKITNNLYNVYGIQEDGDKLSFYYTVVNSEEIPLYDLVEDNVKMDVDLENLEAPSYNDYEPWYGMYEDDQGIYYENRAREKFYINPADYPELDDDVDIAYATAEDLYNAAMAEYEAAFIYERLNENTYYVTTYDLYYYDNGESTQIATGLNSTIRYAKNADVLMYTKAADFSTPVADLQGLLDGEYEPYIADPDETVAYDQSNYIYILRTLVEQREAESGYTVYQNKNGNESELLKEEDLEEIGSIYALSDKELVWRVCIDEEWSLRTYKVDKNGLTYKETIAEDESITATMDSDAGALYYFTDVDNEDKEGDLFCYSNGKVEEIAKGVTGLFWTEDQRFIASNYDFDDKNRVGTVELALDKKSKDVEITDELNVGGSVCFLKDGGILFIADENLCYWNGKETTTIAKDVVYFSTNNYVSVGRITVGW